MALAAEGLDFLVDWCTLLWIARESGRARALDYRAGILVLFYLSTLRWFCHFGRRATARLPSVPPLLSPDSSCANHLQCVIDGEAVRFLDRRELLEGRRPLICDRIGAEQNEVMV